MSERIYARGWVARVDSGVVSLDCERCPGVSFGWAQYHVPTAEEIDAVTAMHDCPADTP